MKFKSPQVSPGPGFSSYDAKTINSYCLNYLKLTLISLLCTCGCPHVCGHMCLVVHVAGGAEDNLRESYGSEGIELRSLGLAASACTH